MFPKSYPKLKKNTKRCITKKVADQVKARDVDCILCKMPIEALHHIRYGRESIYTPNRNDADQLVGLCNSCHHKLHNEGGNDYREFCKDYLRKMYP